MFIINNRILTNMALWFEENTSIYVLGIVVAIVLAILFSYVGACIRFEIGLLAKDCPGAKPVVADYEQKSSSAGMLAVLSAVLAMITIMAAFSLRSGNLMVLFLMSLWLMTFFRLRAMNIASKYRDMIQSMRNDKSPSVDNKIENRH